MPVQDKSGTSLHNTDQDSHIENIGCDSGSQKLFNLDEELLGNK